MPMTIVVTRDAPRRTRGFLASVMLEVAPGVYTAPRMNKAVRERVWSVLESWQGSIGRGGLVMAWADRDSPAGQSIRVLGGPPRELVEKDGLILSRRSAPTKDSASE
jgi:CRISPR-associated protein Cas2